MKKIINILIIILSVNQLMGQDESYLAPINKTIDMFPKTPEAAALSKFVDIPPGDFTGVANFTIPIYTINVEDINIPINLTYTTTGIKVGEIASRVGLGWALNVGPSLSQQVVGSRDRFPTKPVLKFDLDASGPCAYDTWVTYSFTDPSPCGVALSSIGLEPFSQSPKSDLQPDIFSYNLLDASGHFIIDYNGQKGVPRPFNMIKIVPKTLYGSLSGIEMTDEKGIIYNFNDNIGLKEIRNITTCNPDNEEDDLPNLKLQTIVTPSNKIIQYNYTKSVSATYISSITEDEIIDKQNVGSVRPEYLPAERCVNKTAVFDKVLRDITFDEGKVLFYYNNDPEGFSENIRQDLRGDVYLTRVIVKDNNNNIIKDITLNYNYFLSNDSAPALYASILANSPEIYRRLKLTGVKDNLAANEYKLLYYGDQEGISLPNRMSFSQDFWGVYNGKNNTSPIASLKTNTINNSKVKVYMGANKLPDINYGIIGNLKKITYPTGGYTQITYEADDYYKEIYNPAIYDYKERHSDETDLTSEYVEFEILNDGLPVYNQSIILYDSECPPNSLAQVTDNTPMWELWKKNSSGQFTKQVDGFVCTKPVNRDDGPGIYRLMVYERNDAIRIPVPGTGTRTITGKYSWINEIRVNNSPMDTIGTIRIKQIESNSFDNGKILRKYQYKKPNTNLSSGRNQGQELLVSLSKKEVDVGPSPPARIGPSRSMQYITRSNNPGWQLTTVRGKAVGYEYVQEVYESSIDSTQHYKKESKFNLGYSDPLYQYYPLSLNNITYPQKILDDGLLLEETLYNKAGDTVRWTKNEYEYDPFFNQYVSMNLYEPPYSANSEFMARGFEAKTRKVDTDRLGGKYFYFNSNYFDLVNMWIKNVKSTVKDYKNNQVTLVTERTSAYSTATPRHTFPVEKKSEVVGSATFKSQHFQYAFEKGNTYLTGKNMIGIPLVTETTKTNNGVTKTISKTETVYPATVADARTRIINNTNNKDIPLPYDVYSNDLETPSTTSLEVTYEKYDTDGNLLQYTTKSGIPTAIIWGYNNTQPIAKIEGATYAQASNVASTIVTASNTDATQAPGNDESALLTALDSFRNNAALSGYQITTYTYDPLIGVRTITPPSGARQVYIYDSGNRLKEVKDINGNILKSYEYHYKP